MDSAGNVLGTHEGHQHFTVGQRRGVRIALGYPIYVANIDPVSNRVTVGGKEALLRGKLRASQINLLTERADVRGGEVFRCEAKIRYNHPPQPARGQLVGDELVVAFDEPQSAITPGQAVVLYDGDVVLGGGWIESAAR